MDVLKTKRANKIKNKIRNLDKWKSTSMWFFFRMEKHPEEDEEFDKLDHILEQSGCLKELEESKECQVNLNWTVVSIWRFLLTLVHSQWLAKMSWNNSKAKRLHDEPTARANESSSCCSISEIISLLLFNFNFKDHYRFYCRMVQFFRNRTFYKWLGLAGASVGTVYGYLTRK